MDRGTAGLYDPLSYRLRTACKVRIDMGGVAHHPRPNRRALVA